jgi:hypothetical protein
MLPKDGSRTGAFWSSLAFWFSVLVALIVVVTRHFHLPAPLPAATTPNSQFSGARSRAVLEKICLEASPRNVGSPGHILTRELLLDKIHKINEDITGVTLVQEEKKEANSTFEFWSASDNSSGQAYWEVSTQVPLEPCDMAECPNSWRCSHTCIKNIIFRLRVASSDFDATPRRGTLLLAAHYDGVPDTQAATDDGTGVAGTFGLCRNVCPLARAS